MFEEIIKELDEKVELLINKNIQYKNETERLRSLLNSAIDESSASNHSIPDFLQELKPLAQNILLHVEKADESKNEASDGEQDYA